jgi:hypothetical protein
MPSAAGDCVAQAPALASSPPGSDSTPDLAAIGTHVYILAMLYIELAIIIVLILINGFLALAELAIVSSRRARLQALVDRDVIGSRRALALASDPVLVTSTPSSPNGSAIADTPARRSRDSWNVRATPLFRALRGS